MHCLGGRIALAGNLWMIRNSPEQLVVDGGVQTRTTLLTASVPQAISQFALDYVVLPDILGRPH